MAEQAERQQPAWHATGVEQAMEALAARRSGLAADEVEERRRRHGPNRLPRRQRAGLPRLFLRQFRDPLIYVLLVAGTVSLAVGSGSNAAFIYAVLLVNAGIGTFQEWRAESSAEALQETVRVRTRVRRDEREQEIEATELVPGDIVLLESGATVPADLRLLESGGLRADESLLTGESEPVEKDADAGCAEDAALGERATMLHAGSQVLSGRGVGVVCRTGSSTEVGAIARSLAEEAQAPPLVLRMQAFTRRIAVAVLAAVLVLSALELARGRELAEIFFLGVALAVSAIPAGLPVAITVALSAASTRMARRQVIVRRLAAVEGLGSATLVASDKTGTLTANALTIRVVRLPGDAQEIEVGGTGHEQEGEATRGGSGLGTETRDRLQRLVTAGILANEASMGESGEEPDTEGDPVDVAFLVLAAKLGIERDALLEEQPRAGFLPFESERRFGASLHREDGETVAWVKGAAETVAGMCEDVDPGELEAIERELADRGLRVLACARGAVEAPADGEEPDPESLRGLELLGLVGCLDPLREGVPDAVERCRSAGVEVRMITGDHPATALQIARRIGIEAEDDQVASGQDLREASGDPDRFAERVREARVFARIEPTQKTEIVKALQAGGAFVAVTGDGVNDAPALRTAHVGVAMGRSGTDVARNASDLIITDDDFSSIVNGIEEGRTAYDNVRRVIWLLLSTGTGEVLLFFLALLVGLPLPLTPVQLLWLNLVTNGVQDVALAVEEAEPDVLQRPPRSPEERIFDRRMLRQTALSGGYIGSVGFAVYWWLLSVQGLSPAAATNLILLLMVLFENVHVFSCRSEERSAFRVPIRSNPWLVLAVLAAQGIHILAMWLPGLSDVLGTSPVSLGTWLALLPVAASLLLFDEGAKWLHRRRGASRDS